MINNLTIHEIADEILQSILITSKKQRRIRSGSFWKKFGFERRTKERIEAVKSALNSRSITLNLDDSQFGAERRSELIILSYIDKVISTSKVKSEPKKSVTLKPPTNIELDLIPKFDEIQARLKRLSDVGEMFIDLTVRFSVIFVEMFWNEKPNYELKPNVFGATRSNWTYHTAIAFAQTCKIMDFTCKFETEGKRDALIQTKDSPPEILLIAEWEWDYDDIFGERKELEKLKISCKKYETANAFLLTYCPASKYLSYLEKIAKEWIGDTTISELGPTLFLHTIIFQEKSNYREFKSIKTVMIHPSGIDIWNDVFFYGSS